MNLAAPAVDPRAGVDERARRQPARRRVLAWGVLVLLVVVVGLLALGVGPVSLTAGQIGRALIAQTGLLASDDQMVQAVVWQIRLPRAVFGFLIGGALGIAGASLQGLFRNPLADPGLIGISAGAATAAVAVIVLGEPVIAMLPDGLGLWLLPVAAFVGSLIATWVVYRISQKDGRPVVATMLLAGIAINAVAGAITGILVFLARDDQIRDLTFWSLGSLAAASWEKVGILLPFVLVLLLAAPRFSRALNALLLGEAEAGHLGFDTDRLKRWLIVVVTLAVGGGVAFAGTIGFVGLVVPHLIRLSVGPDHRFLLPASALLGAAVLTGADTVARTIASPAELPIGVVMALVGGPFFLWLLMRSRGTWQ